MTVDPKLFAEALAEIRAIRPKQPAVEQPKPQPRRSQPRPRPYGAPCCKGDRTGYQQHKKRGEEACEASKAAEAAYQRARRGRPDAVRKPPECPSYAAYLAHLKRGEEPCEGDKEAKRAYDRERYAKNPRKARAPQREYEARQRAVRQGAVAA